MRIIVAVSQTTKLEYGLMGGKFIFLRFSVFLMLIREWVIGGPYKPRTGQCVNHALAILAAPAVYCMHGRIIDRARNRQTVQNVSEKHAPSPSAATANTHRPSNCSNF